MRRGLEKKNQKGRKPLLCSSREPRSKLNFQNHLYLHQYLKKKSRTFTIRAVHSAPDWEEAGIESLLAGNLKAVYRVGLPNSTGTSSSLTESLLWIIEKGIKKGYCYSAKKTGQSTGKKESAFQVFSQKPTSLSATTGYREPSTKGVQTRFSNNPSLILFFLQQFLSFPVKALSIFYILTQGNTSSFPSQQTEQSHKYTTFRRNFN